MGSPQIMSPNGNITFTSKFASNNPSRLSNHKLGQVSSSVMRDRAQPSADLQHESNVDLFDEQNMHLNQIKIHQEDFLD